MLSSKGQITIPGALRKKLGIEAGSVLEFREEAGRIIISKAHTTDPVSGVLGILQDPRGTDRIMESLRGPALE
jgi:AbrB family looped-hinge helix DNA binding protein